MRSSEIVGYLVYNNTTKYTFDDRTLAHLKVAITSKLRMQECFLLSWPLTAEDGGGRVSIWIGPAIPLEFLYAEPTPPSLNRAWLEALARSSHGLRGMVAMSETDAEAIAAMGPGNPKVYAEINKVVSTMTSPIPTQRPS